MSSGGSLAGLRGELTEFAGQRTELALVRLALGAARPISLVSDLAPSLLAQASLMTSTDRQPERWLRSRRGTGDERT